MRYGRLVLALAVMGLAAGCTEQPGPAEIDPVFDFTNNPDNGNPMIERYEWIGWINFVDTDAGLWVMLATSAFDFGCHPASRLTWHHQHDVVHDPASPARARVNALTRTRDAHITVYRGSGIPPAAGRCAALAAAKLAEGTGQFTWTDNDANASNYEQHNHNAFGTTAQAKLTRTGDGGTVHFNMTARCVWDDNDEPTNCHTKINLK